jgi:hypothetical protein
MIEKFYMFMLIMFIVGTMAMVYYFRKYEMEDEEN